MHIIIVLQDLETITMYEMGFCRVEFIGCLFNALSRNSEMGRHIIFRSNQIELFG